MEKAKLEDTASINMLINDKIILVKKGKSNYYLVKAN
jgi:hypothetical protein